MVFFSIFGINSFHGEIYMLTLDTITHSIYALLYVTIWDDFQEDIRKITLLAFLFSGVFKTMCEIDITYYPFDEQTCVLVFGAWSYQTTKMNLTNISNTVNLDSYKVREPFKVEQSTQITSWWQIY